jgi:MoxR-like ATPase
VSFKNFFEKFKTFERDTKETNLFCVGFYLLSSFLVTLKSSHAFSMNHFQSAPQNSPPPAPDLETAERIQSVFANLKSELSRSIVGLDDEIHQIFIALLCRGHCILEGAPGLAKTKLISCIAALLDLSFRRVQFTPDLMPGDLTGSEVLQQDMATGERFFRFQKGPLSFASG